MKDFSLCIDGLTSQAIMSKNNLRPMQTVKYYYYDFAQFNRTDAATGTDIQ